MAIASVVVGLLIAAPLAWAKDKVEEKPNTAKTPAVNVEKRAETKQMTYLGVGVEALHLGFWAHLRDVLEHEQGVMVSFVAKDSPAETAGLQQHDILTTYGDQKLYSPEQFVKLVQADKAGHEVKLGIVREGKAQEIIVTLGEHAVSMARHWHPHLLRNLPQAQNSANSQVTNNDRWQSFDSMTLKSLGDHRYKVEVGYKAKDGKTAQRTFEGTREEIQKDILAQKDLPAHERQNLLRSLNMTGGEIRLDFPSVYYTPDGNLIWEFPDLDNAF
jgi:predicted metalloprotease with PDZ domain